MILADTNTSVQKQTKTILPYRTLKKSQIEPNKRDQRGWSTGSICRYIRVPPATRHM